MLSTPHGTSFYQAPGALCFGVWGALSFPAPPCVSSPSLCRAVLRPGLSRAALWEGTSSHPKIPVAGCLDNGRTEGFQLGEETGGSRLLTGRDRTSVMRRRISWGRLNRSGWSLQRGRARPNSLPN